MWKWFQEQNRSNELESLYGMLNNMWQEDRKITAPDQLAEYSQPFDIEGDPGFQKFMRDLNSKNPPSQE